MKLALSMLCENPDRRTGLSTLFHEFVAHALVQHPEVRWVLFAGPNQPWEIHDPRVEVVRRFPANDRPCARLLADHLRVAPEARRRGADALLTVGFVPWRDAGLPVVMHVFSVHHLRAGGGPRMAYRRWAMRRGIGRARLVIANSRWTAAQLASAYGLEGGLGSQFTVHGSPSEEPEVAFGCRAGSPDPAGSSVAAGTARSTSSASRACRGRDPALHQTDSWPAVVVSYEGLQHERFRPEGPRGRGALPREYLLWSSNLYRYKRVELALAAYAVLPRPTRTRFPLVLAGGDWHGGRRRAEAAARRLGIREHVRFLGWVSDAELPALYRGARAHVLSTAEETFGRSVAEAMACGCPCVLQDLPVLREVAGGAAVFTDFTQPASAAAELERVCTDDALVAALGEAGRRRAAAFSFERLTRERIEAIERAVATVGSRFTVHGSRLGGGPGSERKVEDAVKKPNPRRQEQAEGAEECRAGSPNPAGGFVGARWIAAGVCAVAGGAVFQWFGNANHGYIDTNSLFWWWGFQWWNPASETQQGWLVLALSGWLLARALRREDATLEARGESNPQGSRFTVHGSRWAAAGGGDAQEPAEGGKGPEPRPQPPLTGLSPLASGLAPLAAMVGGLLLHAVGFAAQQARLSIVALLLFTWGVLRLGGGRRWGAAAVFPLAFLVFAIPVNVLDSVGFWLRLGVVHASAAIAHAAGIGVIENGTQLVAPDGRYNYDVAAACSGVRSLMALAALSLLIGYLNFRAWGLRLLVLLLCFPLVFVGNVARITAIVFAAQAGGPRWGDIAHEVMGWGIFAIVLGGVLGTAAMLRRVAPEQPGSRFTVHGSRWDDGAGSRFKVQRSRFANGEGRRPPPRGDLWPLASELWPVLIVVLFALAEMLFLHRLARLPAQGRAGVALAADGRDPVELPAILGADWVGLPAAVTPVERAILPPDTGYSRMLYVSSRAPRRVFLSIVLSGRDRTSIHRPELCLLGQGWTILGRETHRFAAPAGGALRCTVLRVFHRSLNGGAAVPQLVAYWFVGDDRVVPSYWRRLAWDAWYRIVHGRADRWAYVLLQSDAADGEAAALARMQRVLNRTLPVFEPNRLTTNEHE